MERGGAIQRRLLIYFSSLFVLISLFYTNCSAPTSAQNSESSDYGDSQNEWPWPNASTTELGYGKMVSDISFADVDGDGIRDGVFLSLSHGVQAANALDANLLLRVVYSGSFREKFNFQQFLIQPSLKVRMLLVDVELDDSTPELVYLSADESQVIVMALDQERRGETLFQIPVVESVDTTRVKGFIHQKIGLGLNVQIGHNLIYFSANMSPSVYSTRLPLDGGWTNWSDPACSKRCGTEGNLFQLRSCTQPTPLNGGAQCEGESVRQMGACPDLRACRPSDCLVHEMFVAGASETEGNCVPDPNYNGYALTGGGRAGSGGGGGSTGGGTNPGGGGGVVTDPGSCPAGKIWDPRLFRCFTPYTISDIWISYTESFYSRDESYEIVHRYRLSLSHPKAVGVSAQTTASMYCMHRGYADVMSYETGAYTAATASANVFVVCHPVANGMYYGRSCPVGWYDVSFAYKDMTHVLGEQVTYLKSVTCRKDEGFSSQSQSTGPI